jgi:hypothetical protein
MAPAGPAPETKRDALNFAFSRILVLPINTSEPGVRADLQILNSYKYNRETRFAPPAIPDNSDTFDSHQTVIKLQRLT